MATDTMISMNILNNESKPEQHITDSEKITYPKIDTAVEMKKNEIKDENIKQDLVIVKINKPQDMDAIAENQMCCNPDVKVRFIRFVTAMSKLYSDVLEIFCSLFQVLLAHSTAHIYIILL